MRIQFVVNTTGLTGGIRVVFEYANRLQARGHEVRVIHVFDLEGHRLPAPGAWKVLGKRLKYALRSGVRWFDLEVPVLRIPRLEDRWLPPADAVIATANETADGVAGLDATRGTKFYLVQHDETWTRDRDLVRATWKLPLHKIVIATWLERLAAELGERVVATIPNGVNLEEFHPTGRTDHDPPCVLLMTHHQPWKGTEDALQAFELVRASGRHFALTCFGTQRFSARERRLGRTVHAPTGERLRQLYCAHDIFVSPSWTEGCQLPPMEAMACGCAVVATNVGGIPDYAVPGETALVVEPRRPQDLAAALARLLDEPALRTRVARAGLEHIRDFTWERATLRFEKALQEHVGT